ncbi:helix-turn-helix domain-containing protein [Marinobacter sp. 71-i]|uniref:Helix-turn-helix domain-containing protein n=1 Tax=Marinobacter iranensis TaxID=2962607 RepID=A0ABT5YBB3_9GAMM|nr:helix-turn-helix domain-containing protein [Marinobacter iranensis]MDF0750975.1 helix-turn-helix domain-containing protein [Marinobacter iranensis]
MDDNLLSLLDGRTDQVGGLCFETFMVGLEERVNTTYGPSLEMDFRLSDSGQADIVYVPPLAVVPTEPFTLDAQVIAWLKQQYEGGALICAACTGTLALGASGLLDGQPATTHWAFADLFSRLYPGVDLRAERTLIAGGRDMRLVTAGAHASWHDLMLYLIHRYAGAASARRVAKLFLLDWHELDQNAYSCFRENFQHEDAVIRSAQQWFADNLSHPEPVKAMLERVQIPQRSFQRRFRQATGHTPVGYIQHLRVEEAKNLLESTELSVEDSAWRIGYEDPAYFRQIFRRITGMTPARYRKAFRTPPDVLQLLPAQESQ